jgi:hypothetical protein
MSVSPTRTPRPFTVNDIRVGTRLYEVLVRHARDKPGKTIFYGDLLAQARALFPLDAEVERAVPIGIGMKLLFVQAFCEANGYPNLACLAVNKGKHIPGVSYPGDWDREMREVAAFDWAATQPVLDAYVSDAIVTATPLRRISEAAAREIRWLHFKDNRAAYTPLSEAEREEIVNILMSGVDVERALAMTLEAKSALS